MNSHAVYTLRKDLGFPVEEMPFLLRLDIHFYENGWEHGYADPGPYEVELAAMIRESFDCQDANGKERLKRKLKDLIDTEASLHDTLMEVYRWGLE